VKKTLIAMLALAVFVCCLTGCQKEPIPDAASAAVKAADGLEAFLKSAGEKADAIMLSLEQENLTQTEMNQKSEELRTLWDEALNRLLDEADKMLSDAELEQLAAEQSAWDAAAKAAAEAAGKAYEGGSLYPLAVNSEAARLTEERVGQLYERLKRSAVTSE